MIIFDRYNEELKKLSSSFSCGNKIIDNFLKSSDSLESDICKTYVMIETERKEIIGFFSLCTDAVLSPPKYKDESRFTFVGGAIRIYMFAIDEKYQKQSVEMVVSENETISKTYASILLLTCLDYIDEIANDYVGAMYIILSATKEGIGLYRNIGKFEFLSDEDEEFVGYIKGDGPCALMYRFIKEY